MTEICDTFARALITLNGPDTITLLERLVTNDTSDWQDGETRYGALLSPQGKVIADFEALRTSTGVDLNVSTQAAVDLAKRLTMFRLRADVEIAEAGIAAPLFASEVERLAAGTPVQGIDFGVSEVFPSDINMDHRGGVALNKGCFVGQEVVSRMHRRGNIRRRTVSLNGIFETVGELVTEAGLALGPVTSMAGDLALARVRIDRLAKALEGGAELTVNDKTVTLLKTDWLEAEMAAFLKDD